MHTANGALIARVASCQRQREAGKGQGGVVAETARKARLSVPSSSLPWLVGLFPCDRPAPTACDAGDQNAHDGALSNIIRAAAASCPNLRSVMRHPVVSPLILRIEIIRLTVGSGEKPPPQISVSFPASRLQKTAILLIRRLPSATTFLITIPKPSAYNRFAQRPSGRRVERTGQPDCQRAAGLCETDKPATAVI
jgi:hypothetical protein